MLQKLTKKTKVLMTIGISVALLILFVVFLTDEYGTPWFMWNWTYGLIDGRYRAIACEGFEADANINCPWAEGFRFSTRIVGLHGGDTVGRPLDGDEITVNLRRVSIHGSAIFWRYLQVSLNGDLVRHRWPRADAIYANRLRFQLGLQEFQTESFVLRRGRNEIVITAIHGYSCVSKTFYIYIE